MKKMVIFDRDGTIIIDHGYTHKLKDLKWMTGAIELLRGLNEIGICVVVATNQSGIGRGYFSQEEVRLFHAQMSIEAKANGGKIDTFYICPHSPDLNGLPACSCRKPNPGMLVSAMQDFHVNPEECIFVGNSESDLEAAKKIGIEFVHVDREIDVNKIMELCKC